MSKLAILRDILHENFRQSNQNYLTEKDTDSKGNTFEVKYKIVKQQQIAYELFRYDGTAFPFFKDKTDLKKMCDYILFAEERDFLYIFLIELKLGNMSANKQLNAAKEFVEFILRSAKRIGMMDVDLNYKIKKIRICDTNVNKKRRQDSGKNIQFDGDDYCDYPFKHFYLEPLMQ
jgi:hypothetical protein